MLGYVMKLQRGLSPCSTDVQIASNVTEETMRTVDAICCSGSRPQMIHQREEKGVGRQGGNVFWDHNIWDHLQLCFDFLQPGFLAVQPHLPRSLAHDICQVKVLLQHLITCRLPTIHQLWQLLHRTCDLSVTVKRLNLSRLEATFPIDVDLALRYLPDI